MCLFTNLVPRDPTGHLSFTLPDTPAVDEQTPSNPGATGGISDAFSAESLLCSVTATSLPETWPVNPAPGAFGDILNLQQAHPRKTDLRICSGQLPTRAGIDPYNKIIDRVSDDNEADVSKP